MMAAVNFTSAQKKLAWSVSALATFTGLLVDFRGAASQLASIWPILEALLPIISLVGTALAVLWLVQIAWAWWRPRRKSERLKALEYLILQLLHDLPRDSHYATLDAKLNLWTDTGIDFEKLAIILKEDFDIETPRSKQIGDVLVYLRNLLPFVRRGELRQARNLARRLSKADAL